MNTLARSIGSVLLSLLLFASVWAIEPGDAAPSFSLSTFDGGTFGLSDHQGEIVVLFFFGCT